MIQRTNKNKTCDYESTTTKEFDFSINDCMVLTCRITSEKEHIVELISYSMISEDFKGVLNIPSSVTYCEKTYNITSIGDRVFDNCRSLTSIIIPDSVTWIGNSAFYGCESLKSIIIPDSVTWIGNEAFEDCESLKSIIIPDSVTSFGYEAFYGCNSLKSIIIPDSVTSIGYWAFAGCKSLKSIIIPDGVTSIGDKSFYGCESLTSIIIPDSVTSFGYEAFYGCKSLISINVDDKNNNYSSIDGVLYNKSQDTIICCPAGKNGVFTIPDSVTSIGYEAFYGCKSLISINVDDKNNNYSSIDGVLYNKSQDTIICCPAGKNGVFTIPDSVTSIGDKSFYGCESLTSIIIPNSVTSFGYEAFYGCKSLISINVDDKNNNYSSIDGVLYNKSQDTIICCPAGKNGVFTIPDSVTSFGYEAFKGCESLTSIIIPDSVTSFGYEAFYGCKSLISINVDDKNNNYSSIDGVLYNKSQDTIICCPAGKNGVFTIPDSVTSFGYHAFYDCESLTSIIIPDSVTCIGDYAFSGCYSLKSIIIPNSVTWIGEESFSCCTSLKSIIIPDSVTSIGDRAFLACHSLKSIIIPDSVTCICDSAFYGCKSLTSIIIPDSVTWIGDRAFSDCHSLTSIIIPSVTWIGDDGDAFDYYTKIIRK